MALVCSAPHTTDSHEVSQWCGETPFKRARNQEKLEGMQSKLHHISRDLRRLWNLPRCLEKTAGDEFQSPSLRRMRDERTAQGELLCYLRDGTTLQIRKKVAICWDVASSPLATICSTSFTASSSNARSAEAVGKKERGRSRMS